MRDTASPQSVPDRLDFIAKRLCDRTGLTSSTAAGHPHMMPSLIELKNIIDTLRSVLFPGYFNTRPFHEFSLFHHIASDIDAVYGQLTDQIRRGFCFACTENGTTPPSVEESRQLALALLDNLPEIRQKLTADAQACYEGDPAATSPGEAVFCYPSMYAMTHHRIAHELYVLGVPLIPRIIAEMAHSHTGIDIHPGASIGNAFFIDHATGVVIGETCIIGDNCRIYQGVTLGALSFPKNKDGSLVKGIPRHPILKDNVTVYAGATILGRITIGRGAVIGGNVWITEDVPDGKKVTQKI